MDTDFSYSPASDLLQERVILITGAGGGLGGALAQACAALGATVVLSGHTVRKLEATYDCIVEARGPQPAILPMNLMTATWAEYEAFAASLEQNFGRLDGLVHAAAHFKGFSRLEDLEPREWLDSLQVNLTAPYALTRLCLPLLRKSADASVIQVTDEGGRKVRAYNGIYGIAKRAAEALANGFALELKHEANLRFNTVDPGPMRTALRARGYAAEVLHDVPLPETRLSRLLWLLGGDARGISGRAF
ncbi:SDR family NAD(P)-dependent oxidoreductase [Panacagrimonas sp.]|uniref:SDR family NAD(P)-dependent oxidoreductase n=1 Tax=Panacagrimonas sp. TaxID=2480088 RepID=UPI003B52E7ED